MTQKGEANESGLTPIPTPIDFPVQWDHPEDQRLFWTHNRLHNPEQILPLEEVHIRDFVEHGFNAAADAFEMVVHSKNRLINTYSYSARIPVIRSEGVMKAQAERSEQRLADAIADLGDLWLTEFLPEIKKYISEWESFDLPNSSMPELINELERTLIKTNRMGEIHFHIVIPMNEARSQFEDLFKDLFGNGGLGLYKLLQGFDNKSLETNRELWKLSRTVRSSPQVRKVVEENALGLVMKELQTLPEARRFLANFRGFLKEYGRRSDNSSIHEPSWIEDPTLVIQKLRQYLIAPDQGKHDLNRLVNEREELLAQTRKRLVGYPQDIINRFESTLKNAQIANTISEDHAFWIDNALMYYLREIFLEFGRRFSDKGVMDNADDVWNLKPDELFETAQQFPRIDRHQLIAERRAVVEHFSSVSPPAALGSRSAGPRPDSKSGRAVSRFMGVHASRATSAPLDDPNTIPGQAASSGVARGPACVCHSLSEAAKLKSGDILVAETTLPAWTHLFAIANAVVTDVGGILSHCAVVAREYGIPAVVDTGVASSSIKDGQLIEVDGNAGVVRIIPSS